LASHGTSTTVVSKAVATSTNAAIGSSVENFFFFRRGSFVLGSCYSSTNKQIIKLVQRYTVESIGLTRCLCQATEVCNAFATIVTFDVSKGAATSP